MGRCIISCGRDRAHYCTDDCFLHVTEGNHLRDLKYNNIACFYNGLPIYDDEKEASYGSIEEALRPAAHLVDRKVESCSTLFDMFAIRLKKR